MTVSDKAVEAAARALAAHDCLGGPNWDFANEHWQGFAGSAEAALEAAAPHMLPAPEGVSEAEERVEDWLDGKPYVEIRASDVRSILSALSSERERAERAEQERDDAIARWCIRMADVREASGVGVKPMLDEVPGAIKARIDAIEARAQAAEAKVKEAEETLRPFLALARAVTVDGSPDFVSWAQEAKDWTVAFSFAGHSISLGDLRALAALRWTQGEGE